jgi:UDP-N-acetylmuramate dehydrogenase
MLPSTLPRVVEENIPLHSYTTLGVGGVASYFARVDSLKELQEVVAWAKQQNIRWYILGGGSNILVPDTGVSGVVIRPDFQGRVVIEKETDDEVLVTYGAGMNFDDCVADTVNEGWWGIENLSYIPGTIGATPIQNVGAYGVEVADVLHTVTVYDTVEDEEVVMTADDCRFGYRTSRFKETDRGRYIVTAVTFRLSKIPTPVLSYKDIAMLAATPAPTQVAIRKKIISIRSQKFPDWNVVGTAGSFFKNPIIPSKDAALLREKYSDIPMYEATADTTKISLGYILDKVCNLRGYKKGNIRLYEQQALVLVADRGATAEEINIFADDVAEQVKEKTKITIEREVVRW